jgi:DNA-binding GntR family transcriptional regulator
VSTSSPREFAIARPTVVGALRTLRQDGWIGTQQGKGSFVRGRPALAGLAAVRRGETELDRDEPDERGELLEVATAAAPVGAGNRIIPRLSWDCAIHDRSG